MGRPSGRHPDTALQNHTYFAALDLVAEGARFQVIGIAVETLDRGRRAHDRRRPLPSRSAADRSTSPPTDSGDALGLAPARLTLTFGFGPGLFEKEWQGPLRARRPTARTRSPICRSFNGDQMSR